MLQYQRKSIDGGYDVNKVLRERICVSLFVIAVFIFGRNIPLPYFGVNSGAADNNLATLTNILGGSTYQTQIFMLGLGPYMSSMILWRLISMIKWFRIDQMTFKMQQIARNLVTVFIAWLQAYATVASFSINGAPLSIRQEFNLICILVAGAQLLVALGRYNERKGLGGPSLLVMFGMLSNLFIQLLTEFPELWHNVQNQWTLLWVTAVFILLTFAVAIFTNFGETRLKVNRIFLFNEYKEQSYFPISYNPGGGIAIMYGFSIMLLFATIFSIVSNKFPDVALWHMLSMSFGMNGYIGVTVYTAMIFTLTYAFAFINIDIIQVTENLRNSGDYFEGVMPGRQTQKYLTKYVRRNALIGATVVSAITAVPFYFSVFNPSFSVYTMIPGLILISFGIGRTIYQQIKVIRILDSYESVL